MRVCYYEFSQIRVCIDSRNNKLHLVKSSKVKLKIISNWLANQSNKRHQRKTQHKQSSQAKIKYLFTKTTRYKLASIEEKQVITQLESKKLGYSLRIYIYFTIAQREKKVTVWWTDS